MPRRIEFYSPDQLDCNTLTTAIGGDFGLRCEITTDYTRDQVVVLVRCRPIAGTAADVVSVQAIVRAPLKTAKSLYTMHYAALLDCWHQCDRGVLAAATRPIEHGWNGRPKVPRARNAQ
jgi:hypothetical protein